MNDYDSLPVSRIGCNKSISVVMDVWIGAAAIILLGVTICDGSVVAAGVVVFADVPPHSILGGAPARVI